jgi:hypothetical protein
MVMLNVGIGGSRNRSGEAERVTVKQEQRLSTDGHNAMVKSKLC